MSVSPPDQDILVLLETWCFVYTRYFVCFRWGQTEIFFRNYVIFSFLSQPFFIINIIYGKKGKMIYIRPQEQPKYIIIVRKCLYWTAWYISHNFSSLCYTYVDNNHEIINTIISSLRFFFWKVWSWKRKCTENINNQHMILSGKKRPKLNCIIYPSKFS